MPIGLVKTQLQDCERKKFSSLGISIDLPKKSENIYARYFLDLADSTIYQKNCDCKATLLIMMHPCWSGQAVTEPQYILNFRIERLSMDAFEKFKLNKHIANQDVCFRDKLNASATNLMESFFKEPDSGREFLCFRKDIKLSNGDIVVCGVDLQHVKAINPKESEDIAGIKKILNSIRPLD